MDFHREVEQSSGYIIGPMFEQTSRMGETEADTEMKRNNFSVHHVGQAQTNHPIVEETPGMCQRKKLVEFQQNFSRFSRHLARGNDVG